MNKKLTISIDRDTIDRAKEYAKAKGQSLSEIIENYLKLISRQPEKPKISPNVSKLKGSITLPEGFDYKEVLAESISSQHSK
jgi:hypothetical protein